MLSTIVLTDLFDQYAEAIGHSKLNVITEMLQQNYRISEILCFVQSDHFCEKTHVAVRQRQKNHFSSLSGSADIVWHTSI
jgi:hypothetical protein